MGIDNMLITREREKLLNAIVYFAENTRHCGKTKLFKLLFLLDFEHFKLTGRSVTGLDYYALPKGPVPVALDSELDEPQGDLSSTIELVPEQVIDFSRLRVKPKKTFDPSHFSKRELRLLEDIANRYQDQYSQGMVDVTHAENGVWEKIYADGKGLNQLIPYQLAVTGADSAAVLSMAEEYAAMKQHFIA